MSFWGGFVQGFAESVGEAIDKDVERTNKLVDDTVKIGVSKYLENEEEIKKEKKDIRDELDMLRGLNFSLPKAASIIRAGQTANVIKLANKYSGSDPNDLWNGTTKFSEESGLTVNDVINKLIKTPQFDTGNLKVSQPSGSLLSALGLGTDVSSRIQQEIGTKVGGITKAVDSRDDISIMPGGLTGTAKGLLTTSSDTIDETIAKLLKKKYTVNGVLDEEAYLKALYKAKNPKFESQFGSGIFSGNQGATPNLNLMQNLANKVIQNNDKDAEDKLEEILLDIAKTDKSKAKALVNALKLNKFVTIK